MLLCGPTGCGKTTLALCLNGLVPHATGGQLAGSVEVGGVNTTRTPTPHMATEVGL
ncbi:MAG: ATP-binding protein [Anaerolineae bacterium]